MGRIVCVSNRVTDPSNAAQAGGVAVAIGEVLQSSKGLWLGWSGDVKDTIDDDVAHIQPVGNAGSALATIDLTTEEHKGYYLGYANSVLWPVFHHRIDLAAFEEGFYRSYADVNKRFARALLPLLEADDKIWVHDYHLIPLASELRALGITNPIGFFLHTPFPPSQTFLAIPEHKLLAHAFAAYDLVGLQTTADVANLIDYVSHGVHARMLPDGRMRIGKRIMSVRSFPIGIDPAFFTNIDTQIANISGAPGVRRIIGVDRLDYSKGLPQKFRAFGRFLEKYPEHIGTVVLTQIAAPTRESVEAYTDIRKELESYSGSINGTYGGLDWVPINYMHRATSRVELPAIFRSSPIAMVTPLRDGMNLVAKEYVAAQDPENPGVLILSQFAGAAEHMHDALIVNPYNIEEMADAIEAALRMDLCERRRRHQSLFDAIQKTDVSSWRDAFLAELGKIARHDHLPSRALPASHLGQAMSTFRRTSRSVIGAAGPRSQTSDISKHDDLKSDLSATARRTAPKCES
jgi:trehalose 6-phosphate synthase